MKKRTVKKAQGHFGLRIKRGDYEVEVNGSRDEVLKTIEALPQLMQNVHTAFESLQPKTTTTITVKKAARKEETRKQKYPKIEPVEKCEDALLQILETDWGKWRPRTLEELKKALQFNKFDYSQQYLYKVLTKLVKKGDVRRWKTDSDHVYILGENESLS